MDLFRKKVNSTEQARGINGEGFNHSQNVFHLTPLEQICPFKKFEVGFQTPQLPQALPLPQTPLWEKPKIEKSEFCFCHGQKCIHSNLKEIIVPCKQKLDFIYMYRSHGPVLSLKCLSQKWSFLSHLAISNP